MKLRLTVLLAIIGGAGVMLAGCGRSEPAAPSAEPAATAGERVVKITADDTMKYSVTEIRAKPGEVLVVTLTNTGRVPKQAMAHNWVLTAPMSDAELNALAMSAAQKAPEYLPENRSVVIAHSRMLGPGESDRVTVTVPANAGEYRFVCTFPGHFAMMKGKLIVQP